MQTLRTKLDRFADEANKAHAEAQDCFRRGVAHAERAGKTFIKAKAEIGHRHWTAWLAENIHGSERTAQLYIRLARKMPQLDDETRTAVVDLSLREAVKEILQPRICAFTVVRSPSRLGRSR